MIPLLCQKCDGVCKPYKIVSLYVLQNQLTTEKKTKYDLRTTKSKWQYRRKTIINALFENHLLELLQNTLCKSTQIIYKKFLNFGKFSRYLRNLIC